MKTKDAIRHFGSASALARALGIWKTAVSQWGDTVPQRRAFEIERLTKGKLKASFTPATQDSRTA
jgi:transcriptional repressor of cell division inhibition gene dicB